MHFTQIHLNQFSRLIVPEKIFCLGTPAKSEIVWGFFSNVGWTPLFGNPSFKKKREGRMHQWQESLSWVIWYVMIWQDWISEYICIKTIYEYDTNEYSYCIGKYSNIFKYSSHPELDVLVVDTYISSEIFGQVHPKWTLFTSAIAFCETARHCSTLSGTS